MNRVVEGAIVGLVGGLAAGAVGEMLVFAVSKIFPTDVLIVGFALVWAVPLGALVGAVCGWRGWVPQRLRRAVAAAVPGLLAGVVAAVMQWSAV